MPKGNLVKNTKLALAKDEVQKDIAILKEFKKKLSKGNAASDLIGVRISPSKTYLRETSMTEVPIKDSEHYCRSEKHTLAKGNFLLPSYKKKKLANGDRAHVGDYCNLMQALGDTFKPSDKPMETTPGTGILYDELLTYKVEACKSVIDKLKGTTLKYLHCGVYNDYPCVMVNIKENSVFKSSSSKKFSTLAFEEWVNFLISYFVGIVNHAAYQANLPIEIERRSSFGFLGPTISPTGHSMRINLGIVPKQYLDIIVKCIKTMDKSLKDISKDLDDPLPDENFYGSKQHIAYLGDAGKKGGKYKPIELDNIVQLLFAQVEKRGKTTVQNIMRTPFARDGIAMEVFNTLDSEEDNSPLDALLAGIRWSVDKLEITDAKKPSLAFKQNGKIKYTGKFSSQPSICNDSNFWKIIMKITKAVKSLKEPKLESILERLNECINGTQINRLYCRLEQLNEIIFIIALEPKKNENFGDGHGSDSEIEDEINEETLYSKKIITHNGMRAIWSSIIAAVKYLAKESNANFRCVIYLENAYYEVPLGIKLIEKLHELPSMTVTKDIDKANIILHDLNACVTTGQPSKGNNNLPKNKLLILDSTSTSTKDVYVHLEKFLDSRSKVLFLVDSGFKHQQIGADKNQYGTVRVFAKTKKVREEFYEKIKKEEPDLLSATSHRHRHLMKKIGAVPITKNYTRS